ncbi:MAG: hypothetical protein CMD98_04600 [Gammaproteobacteria bacterium]|nr:hypothetical protein [Gammaproteobacteria bacterium]|tara:strand:- start:5815 stop:7767 length:1953 start_codon:yes stop_codon:yes gene_type:complete
MANTVNVTTSNTFEQWRTKTNELGTAAGDLDNLTVGNARATNIVSALTTISTNLATAETTLAAAPAAYANVSGDTMTGDLNFNDNVDANFGTGTDLKIYHDGTNSYLTNSTGALKIATETSGIAITLGHGTSEVTVGDNLTVTGTSTLSGGATVTGNVTATGTVEPAGDTAAGDNAAMGYTAAEGLILTGQGSTNDVTIKNDADADVLEIPTGTTNVNVVGTVAAADLKIGSESLDDRYLLVGSAGGSATISTVTSFTNDITMSKTLTLGSETVYNSAASGGFTFSEYAQDLVGAMVDGGTESGISATYNDSTGKLEFDVADPVITLAGDLTGNVTITNLGNATLTAAVVDDSHNHIIGNVDGLQTALDLKADLADPDLTGTPTAPTAASSVNNTQLATTAFVTTAINDLVGDADSNLDTLGELSDAINDDANAYTNLTNSIALKVAKDNLQALHSDANVLTITDNVITLKRGDASTDTVTIPISGTPSDGATTTAISSDWAFDNVKTAVPTGAIFTANDFTNTYKAHLDDATDVNTAEKIVKRSAAGAVAIESLTIGSNGGGDSLAYFYDDNDDTLRTFGWDDSSSEWQVEDQGAVMRTLYHSGNLPASIHGIDDVIVDGTSNTGKTVYIDDDAPTSGDGADGDVWFEY